MRPSEGKGSAKSPMMTARVLSDEVGLTSLEQFGHPQGADRLFFKQRK